ncbi:MAG TPA: hypothetical protein VJ124_14735 [Pyrinomonadaceae bacterium]|nr:hypothetical protein [Pyrinomonadaceae bacterium]
MISSSKIKIVAIVLTVVVALVCVLGYNFFYDKNIRPKESTLIPLTQG